MTNREIAQEISNRIGTAPIPFDSVYSIAHQIYNELGGEPAEFDSVYSILLGILPLVEGGIASKVIDDNVITTDKTWSSNKLTTELGAKQDSLTAGQNISIDSANTISVDGYVYDETDGSLATKYLNTDEDESYIATNTASGEGAFAEGYSTTATGMGNHAEGGATQATGSQCAHAEGLMTVASGKNSHAEGSKSVASGNQSHAEGGKMNGQNPTTAAGNQSHAEGGSTLASGSCSHAEGVITEAKNDCEHAQGNCNVSHKNSDTYGDAGNTIDSIGIGYVLNSVPQRKNATEVMQNGDMYLLGVGGYQGTNTKVQDATVKTLQTVISDINASVSGKQDTLTAGSNISISGNTISATYEVATTAEIEALFVLPSFYVDNALFETYNLTWGQWLDSRYNTSGFTHIYTASTYDSSVEQIPEVVSSAYPTAGVHYYSTCTDTYVPATAPADNEIWYTTESGNLWEPIADYGEGVENTLLKVNNGNVTILSNNYVNGHGIIKYSEPITSLDYNFGRQYSDNNPLDVSDLTTLTLPNSITSVDNILNDSAPGLETIYYNGTVAECKEIDWDSFKSNANEIEEIICLDGTYSLSDEGGGGEYYGGGGGY